MYLACCGQQNEHCKISFERASLQVSNSRDFLGQLELLEFLVKTQIQPSFGPPPVWGALVLTPYSIILILMYQQQTAFKTSCEKEKLFVTSNSSFFHSFQLSQTIVSPFVRIFDIISSFAVELEGLKLAYHIKG